MPLDTTLLVTPDSVQREVMRQADRVLAVLPVALDDVAVAVSVGALAVTLGNIVQRLRPEQRQAIVQMHAACVRLALGNVK